VRATFRSVVPKAFTAFIGKVHTRPGRLPEHSTIARTKMLSPSVPHTISSGDESYVRSAVTEVSDTHRTLGFESAAVSRQAAINCALAGTDLAVRDTGEELAVSIGRSDDFAHAFRENARASASDG
jgi:hypothetical protein